MRSLTEARKLAALHQEEMNRQPVLLVGKGTCGKAAGGDRIWSVLEGELLKQDQNVNLISTGCIGMCYAEPLSDRLYNKMAGQGGQ